MKLYSVIDLFAGAGGLSLGFSKNQNFKIVAAIEKDRHARETYLYNHKNKDIEMFSDVRDADYSTIAEKFGQIDVVIGGPPCQGFSNANRQKNNVISSNNILVKEYFRAVKELNPKIFIMENVKMLSSEKHRFYYSYKDSEEIDELNLEYRQDRIIVAEKRFRNLDVLQIAKKNEYSQFLINEPLFRLLNTLSKKNKDEDKIKSFVDKNLRKLEIEVEKMCHHSFFEDLKMFLQNCKILDFSDPFFEQFDSFMNFQKGIRILEELDRAEIVSDFSFDEENVIANVRSYSVIDYIKNILSGNYNQKSGVINAINYGVPQKRDRFILCGVRKDLKDLNTNQIFGYKEENKYTVKDAIGDLEKIYPGISIVDEPKIARVIEEKTSYSNYVKDSKLIYNHVVTATREKASERFKALKEGQNFHNLDVKLKDSYSSPEKTQNTIYLRVKYDEPSGTVVNVRKSMWVHPKLDRAISIREAARLQSFPDSFVFKGTKDSQYQQVGNAVPPKMASVIAEIVLGILKCNDKD